LWSASARAAPEIGAVAKAQAAFESGAPIDKAVSAQDWAALESGPVASRVQIALEKRLPEIVRKTRELQAVRPPATPSCPRTAKPAADANGCVMEAVLSIAVDFELRDAARVEAAMATYLASYNGPAGQSPAELAAARARAEKMLADPRVPSSARARLQAALKRGDAFKGLPGPAAAPAIAAVTAGPGTRTVEQALKEARSARRDAALKIAPVDVPLSERLAASAADDERILELGPDDGTLGAAVGRSVTQAKKVGSGLLSYFTSGDTWKKTGQGAAQIVTNPLETAKFMPGALAAGGIGLWHGVKADIANASDEIGNFTEHPTYYRGAAVAGSLALAVSNAFIVGGGAKTAARRGAMDGIDQAVKDATQNVARIGREGDIGAAVAPAKPVIDPAARKIYLNSIDNGENVPFFIKAGVLEVDERVTTTAKQQIMFKQTGPTCVFGAVCNVYQGTKGVTPQDVLAAIRRENPAYSNTMATSNINMTGMERISNELAAKAGRTPITLSSTGDFLTHMRKSGEPVLVGVQTGTGQHAIVLSEALVTKEGKVYFKTLDTNISVRPGAETARREKFGFITADDLEKILKTKGFSRI
jgi:hypothetical protein